MSLNAIEIQCFYHESFKDVWHPKFELILCMRGRFDFFPAITLIQWNGKLIFAFQINFPPIICDRNSITSALRQVWTLRLDFNPIKESFYKSTFLSDVIHCIVDHSDAEFALKKKNSL